MQNLKGYLPTHETIALLTMIAIAALIIFVNEWSYQRSEKSRAVLAQNTATRQQINLVLERLTEAESGQRGYLLTGNERFLEPHNRAGKEIAVTLALLKDQYQSQPVQRQIVAKITQLSLDILRDSEVLLRLRQQSPHDAGLENMLLERSEVSMDMIRTSALQLRESEFDELMHERHRVQRTMDLTRTGVHALTLIGLLAFALFLSHIARFKAERREHARVLEAHRNELEVAVLQRTEELSELTRHLQTARDDERAHVARELHDELGALLTAAKFDTARLKRSLGKMMPDVEERIDHLNATINQGIALKRRIIEDLHPSALANLGLIAALEIQAREFEQRTGSTLKLSLDQQVVQLSEDVKLTIYRLVQESFTNIVKYAAATEVQLNLRREDACVVVTVIDNGRGFNPATVPKNSHGLTGMRYRVEAHGGKIRVKSSIGSGTEIEARLPVLLAAA